MRQKRPFDSQNLIFSKHSRRRHQTGMRVAAAVSLALPWIAAATPTIQQSSDGGGSYDLVNNNALQFKLYTGGTDAGKITSIIYNGQQMVGSKDLYYDIQGSPNIYLGTGENYSYRTGSNYIILSAEHPANATEPLDVTWNWILQDNVSGFSTYLTYNHTTGMADYGSSENRVGAEFFNGSLFHYSSITDKFWGYQDAGDPSRAQGTFITAETANVQGIPGEYIKNYETKYDWRSTYQQSSGVTGIFGAPNTTTSTKPLLAQDYGAWTIENPRTWEGWNSGPTHPQTPVADGSSLIPSPAASHFGGPGLTYTGNMSKSFGPLFTYFNTGANISSLRSDAESYTTTNPADPKDLNTFYDSLNLPYYATSAQRGAVNGTIRLADGSNLTGATVILSTFDPVAYASSPISQEYQRRAAGYDYWTYPSANGTFNLTDVRPGTYRVTVIKPGNYRESTFDNITVGAGGTTNVGNLTWKPDISGQGVFQIGTFDRTAGEFRDGANYNNWIDTFNQAKEFPNGVNYTVNPANPFNDTQNWSQNWPLDQTNGSLDFFNVNFTLANTPAANALVTVTLAIAAQEYIDDFAVLVGSNRVDASFNHTADYAPSTVRSGDTTSAVLYRKLSFPGSWLHSGSNAVTFHIVGGDMQYDAVRMDISNPGTFSQSQWNGGSGNWSDATQWSTQADNYTAVNKGSANLSNGTQNFEYGNDTSTTFADGASQTAPVNSTGSSLFYDATINGGVVNLNISPQVQQLSLLSGTLNVAAGTPILTANDAFVLAGGSFNGSGTINALSTTSVNFASNISNGAVINSTGPVTWTDGGTSVTVLGAGSKWTNPGLSLGSSNASSLTIASGGLVSTGTGLLSVGKQGTVLITSGTLNTSGVANAGMFSASGSTITTGTGTFTNSGTATISSGLTGTGVLNAGGSLTLNGTNTYTGTTVITGGVVQFGSVSSIGGTGASITVTSGGAVSFVPGITTAGFLPRLSTASTGSLALTSADAGTTLDFTTGALSAFPNMAIGAIGSVSYSGTYTPAGGIYKLGGGGGTLTYSPAITGSSSVTIGNNGSSGTVVLNTANSYTGTTSIRGGILAVSSLANGGSPSALGQSSNSASNLIIDGGTLQATGNSSTDRLFTLGAGGATLDGSGGSLTFTSTGTIATSGSGNRALTLTGTNTANSFSPALVDPSGSTASLTMAGTGTWTVKSSASSFTGGTTVLSGTLATGSGAKLGSGTLTVALNGTLEISGQSQTFSGLNDGPAGPSGPASPNGNGGGTIDSNSGSPVLTIGNGNASGQFSGTMTGTLSLVKTGTGTQILSGDNTYTGTTTINSGAIQIGVGGTPGSFGPGDGGFRGQFGPGNIINNATLIFNRGYLTTCTNAISGTGTVKQIANAELALGTANTYTGPTLIGEGIANIGQGGPSDGTGLAYSGDCSINASVLANGGVASSIGASSNAASNLILDGGILDYTGATTTTNRLFTVTQNGGAIYASGGMTFTNTGAIVMSGTGNRTLMLEGDSTTACTFNCTIGDPAAGGITSLAKDRSGSWTLTSSAKLTYSGDTDMDMGTLVIGAGEALPYGPGKGNVVFSNSVDFGSIYDPVLEMNGNDLSINGLAGATTGYGSVDNNSGTHTLTIGNNNATAEYLGVLTGGINLVKTGSGNETLDGVNTNTGGTTVNAGALIFSATSAIGGSGKNVAINNGATLGGPGTVVTQTFLNRVSVTSSGVLALTSADTNNLDFSASGAALPNVSLGAIGAVSYSGIITPYGNNYQLGGGGGTLTVTSGLNGSTSTLTVGSSGYTNGAPGTVILTNTNSYGGATSVLAGILQFNTVGSIGGTGASVTVYPGAVVAAGYAIDQPFLSRISIASAGVVALASNSGNALSLSAAGLNNVSVGAVGTETFSGTLSPGSNGYLFGGGGGTLVVSTANAVTGAVPVTVGLGASTPAAYVNPLIVNFSAGQNYTGITTIRIGGTISGALSNGGSAGALGASSNAAGNLVLDGGTLAGVGGTDHLFTLTANGGTLDNSAGMSLTNTGAVITTPGTNVTLNLIGTSTAHNTLTETIANPVSGTLSIAKSGTGKWTFENGAKTYSGDTTVTGGTLETLSGNALSPNSNMVIQSGGDLDFHDTSPEAVNALIGSGVVTNDFSGSHTDTFTIGSNGGSGTFTGSISSGGTFILNKAGNGTQVLSGSVVFTGTTSVNGGTLTLDYAGTDTSNTLICNPSTTFNINGTLSTSAAITGNGMVNFGPNPASGLLSRTIASLALTSTGTTVVGTPTASTNRTVLVTSALTFAGTNNAWQGKLDLTGNDMVVRGGSLANIYSQLKSGYANGNWNGNSGIVSGSAATDRSYLTGLGFGPGGGVFDGISTGTTDVLLKYTYYGDATLDGTVDGSDYTRIDNGFLSNRTGWYNGDFNYDGVVNGSDYALIDNAFNTQGASLSAQIGNPAAEPTAQIATSGSSAVPEPAGMAGLLACGMLLSRRRRNFISGMPYVQAI